MKSAITQYARLFLLVVVALACSKKEHTGELIHFDIKEVQLNPVDLRMSDFIKDIEYVRLENHPDGIIGKIGSIVPAKEYFLTAGYEQELYLFKNTGEFVRQIGGFGKGPGEYSESKKYFWIGDTEEILIYDQQSRQMIFYNLDGRHLRSVELPNYYYFFKQISEREFLGFTTYLLPSTEESSQYSIINIDGSIDYLPVPEYVDYTKGIRGPFLPDMVRSDFGTLFKPAFSDTIYWLNDRSLELFLHVDLGSNKMPEELLFDMRKYYSDLMNYSFFSQLGICGGKWLMITVHDKGSFHTGILDLENPGQINLLKPNQDKSYGIINDLDGGGNWSITDSFYGDQYFTCNSASWLLDRKEDGTFKNRDAKLPGKREVFEKLLDEIQLEDNPVVQIMTVK